MNVIFFSAIIIFSTFLLFTIFTEDYDFKVIDVYAQVNEIASNSTEDKDKRPNILFILSDNQAARLLGTYGNPDIQTPNIDKLADEGIKFTNAYANNGMCSPTRATLLTGLMPSQHGIHNWLDDSLLKEWPKEWVGIQEFRTLPQTLNDSGYDTALIGKWHLGQPWNPAIGFDKWITFTYGHTLDFYNNTIIDNGNIYDVKDKHIVDFFTEQAIEFINNHNDSKPFFLQLSYDGPYMLPPTNSGPDFKNRFYENYVGKDFNSFPRNAVNDNIIAQLNGTIYSDPFLKSNLWEFTRMLNDPETIANMAAQNSIVDDGVGKVLDALQRNGIINNTLVVYTSDQGEFYGQHGLLGHTITTSPSNLYDIVMNVPLIFSQPGIIESNQTNDILVSQIDFAPTILEYVGINNTKFDNSPGKSFSFMLKENKNNNVTEWKNEVYFEQEETRGISTNEYALWLRLNGTGENEFYDLTKDPEQNHNLYNDPSYLGIILALTDKLEDFFDVYVDEKYDLWNDGTAKGSVQRPWMWQEIYGEDWKPTTEVLPKFKDS